MTLKKIGIFVYAFSSIELKMEKNVKFLRHLEYLFILRNGITKLNH